MKRRIGKCAPYAFCMVAAAVLIRAEVIAGARARRAAGDAQKQLTKGEQT